MSSSDTASETYLDLAHKIDPRQIKVTDPTAENVEVTVEYPWNGGRYTNGRLSWGDKVGLCSEFLPFAYLDDDDDPIEAVREIGKFLTSRPATKQRVSTTELYTRAEVPKREPNAVTFEHICLLFGWWHGGETSSQGPYYCNPDYVHGHPEDDYLHDRTYWDEDADDYVNERFDFAIRAARVDTPGSVVSRAFGMDNTRSASKWLHRHGFDWGEKRKAGRQRMARAWKTIHSWGYLYKEIAEAFGVDISTVSGRVRKDAADFEPPADPSYRVVSR